MLAALSQLIKTLTEKGIRVATVESCTGGLIAQTMTEIPGSSAWFECGWVTYSNSAKVTLGVPLAAIEKHGAVSQEVAEAMCAAAAVICPSHAIVATTGIAGPEGDGSVNPVGRVWIATYYGGSIASSCYDFTGDRSSVRQQAMVAAINQLSGRIQSE